MKIKNITVNNIASFINFSNSIEFEKTNLIFGTNGSGKSTLVGLLQALEGSKTDSSILKNYLKDHYSREAVDDIVSVRIELDCRTIVVNYNIRTDNISITGIDNTSFVVFNEQYTLKNIGDIINVNLRDNGFVIGEKSKELEELNKNKEKIRQKKESLKNKANEIIVSTTQEYRDISDSTSNVEGIISVANLFNPECDYQENDELITKRKELGYSKPIQRTSVLDESSAKFQKNIQIIENNCTEIVIQPTVNVELARVLKDYTDFFTTGISIFNDDKSICPFCRRKWENADHIISEYNDYITSTYTAKRNVIKSYLTDIDSYRNNIILLIKNVEKAYEIVEEEARQYSVDYTTWVNLQFNNKLYEEIKKSISDKYESMEKSISVKSLLEVFSQSHESVIKANNAVINKIKNAIDSITTSRKSVNQKLSYHFMKKIWLKHSNLRDTYIQNDIELQELEALIKSKTDDLPAQNTNQKIMNDLLSYMGVNEYCLNTENKLCIRIDKNYDISNEGKRISTAQRKIISLCYFYADIVSRVTDAGKLKDFILVFDDPVDSADYVYFHSISSVIESSEKILSRIVTKKIKFGQYFVLTHNSLLFDRLNSCKWAEWKYNLEKVNNLTLLTEASNNTNNYLEYIKEIARFLKCDKPDKRRMLFIGNIIRRVLEIIASFDNLGSNSFSSILNGMGNTKLAVLANHLSHESFTKVLNPFSDVGELKNACIELFLVIKQRHPYQYETINKKYHIDEFLEKE